MKNNLALKILLTLVVLGGISYLIVSRPMTPAIAPSPSTTSSPFTNSESSVMPSGDTSSSSQLRQGGSRYLDPKGVYNFLYPSDYTLDAPSNSPHVRIYKRAQTERPQSEMTDGVLVIFESVNLGEQSLSTWVDAQIKTEMQDTTTEVTRSKTTTRLNNYPGFTYEMGGSTYLAIQKDPSSQNALLISYLIADPEKKGYRNEVDTILSTLELLQ
jgi:hypothetical protein